MLTKTNRINTAAEFRNAMRKGRKINTAHTVIYVVRNAEAESRAGFIVTKVVGNAVNRNFIRRRLRSIAEEFLPRFSVSSDIVIRPNAGAEELTWEELRSEILTGIMRATKK